jgi:hypothetical protein
MRIQGGGPPANTFLPRDGWATRPLAREGGKPWYEHLWKYAKSLFGSLIQAVERDSKLRAILDAIKEYIECVEASMKFVQEGAPM